MTHEIIHLKDHFPFLGENGNDPVLVTYIPAFPVEMGWDDRKHPAVILCPGGAYAYVGPREGEPVALKLLAMGYSVFVLDYSVAPSHFPTQLREVAAVMELIYSNCDVWQIDTNRIGIMGFSAGGHLAGHYSTCYNIPEVREVFPDSKAVNASILCYPVISADPRYTHTDSIMKLTGCTEITNEIIEKFSLDRHVSAQTPPTYLWHTAADDVVPAQNSLMYAKALAEHGVPFSLHIYPHGVHGLSTADEASNEPLEENVAPAAHWLDHLKDWLKITL